MRNKKDIINGNVDDNVSACPTSCPSYRTAGLGFALVLILVAIAILVLLYFIDFSSIFSSSLRPTKSGDVQDEKTLITKIKGIVSSGDNINAKQYKAGRILLHIAAKSGYVEATELLLANGAVVNAKDLLKQTPLHLAARNGHLQTVELLIHSGADIEAEGMGGETPLCSAVCAESKRKDIVSLLLSAGASVDVESDTTPLLNRAIYCGDIDIVEVLIAHGADVNFKGRIGYTALHCAAYMGRPEIVKLLIQEDADVNARDHGLVTPLLTALEALETNKDTTPERQKTVIEILRSYGAED